MNSQEKKQRGILSLLVSGFLLLIIDLCAQNSQGGWGQSVSKGNDFQAFLQCTEEQAVCVILVLRGGKAANRSCLFSLFGHLSSVW